MPHRRICNRSLPNFSRKFPNASWVLTNNPGRWNRTISLRDHFTIEIGYDFVWMHGQFGRSLHAVVLKENVGEKVTHPCVS